MLIGVDIGGTQVRVAIAPRGSLARENVIITKETTAKDDELAIGRQVVRMALALLDEQAIDLASVEALSIATAGPIDMEKGEVFNNANLGFKTIPLKEPVQQGLPGVPIHLINDCNGAVLGVHCFEARDGERENVAYVTLSTGIGGGVICNGRLLLGKEGNACEVGHGIVSPGSGVRCNCGAEGCWEAFSSGTAVAKHARALATSDPSSAGELISLAGGHIDAISAIEVYKAAKAGDRAATEIVDQANYYNALGLGLMNNFYDCSVVFLGGSVMKDSAQILPVLQGFFEKDPVRFTINKPPQLRKCSLGDDVGVLGALALGKYKLEGHVVLG